MAYEELIQSMEMDAALRIREVQAAAESCVGETLEAARRQADEVRAGHMAEAASRIEVERHQRLYRAREEAKAGLARIREEHLRSAVAAAREELACRRGQDGYPDVLEGLLREALDTLGEDGARVHVDPRDEATVRALLEHPPGGLPVLPDLETTGGVVVDSADERIRVDNTLESRLARAEEVYRRELYDLLYGGA
jgi:V/A-type H+/Na+-transporting ATPase subunit E